jgi:lipoprotein-anchoring transpeptidase ErfK/SrfK
MRRTIRLARRLLTALAVATVFAAAAPAGGNVPATAAPGVSVGGIPLGGLDYLAARAAVREALERPLRFHAEGRLWSVPAERFGVSGDAERAATEALAASADTALALATTFRQPLVRAYADAVATELDRPARDARLDGLRGLAPRIVGARPGRVVDRNALTAAIESALAGNDRARITIPLRQVAPRVRVADLPPVVVVRRESKRLDLFEAGKLVRTFRVATGRAGNATPLGAFTIVDMQREPWWYPPPSDWARGMKPVPPGPGNPLGTRWMGLDRGYLGIHGTPDATSIGYSASRGCVRMMIPDAAWLFERVRHGAPVHIVGA